MKDEFFDWIDQCPVQWFLIDADGEQRSYQFLSDDEEKE